jgi:probable rRNA maturation factor
MISFFEEEISFKLKDKRKLKTWITEICQEYNKKVGNINYIFCDDEYLLKINNDYLKHDYYTDIVTFDQSEKKDAVDGELYISLDRVADNAKTLAITFEKELHRVIIHGILHLLGHGDKTDKDEAKMRQIENKFLKKLEKK